MNCKTKRKTQGTKHGGYRRTQISMADGSKTNQLVHRLVLLAFIGEHPEGKNIVNHKDGDKTNNSLENLEWVTSQENTQHAVDTGLLHSSE